MQETSTIAVNSPTFLLSAGTTLVLLIAWLVRVEFVGKANKERQAEKEAADKQSFTDLRDEIKSDRMDTREWKKIFFAHATDTKVHHNEAMFDEFRKGLDRRFSGVETTLSDMNHKLDRLAEKE